MYVESIRIFFTQIIFTSNNYRAMKDSFSQVRSGQIVRVLQNCCTCPSFIFEGIMINCHPVVYFPFIVSAGELGVANDVSRNNHLFCNTLCNLAMVQQRRSKPMHIVSVSIYMHDRAPMNLTFTCIIHECSCSI